VFDLLHAGCKAMLDWLHATFDTKVWNLIYHADDVAKVPIAILGLVLLVVAWRRRWPLPKLATTFAVYFVACTPTLHPWYLALLVPFLCLYPRSGWLLFTGTVFLAYHPQHDDLWMKVLQYAPFYLSVRSLAPVRHESLQG